jgi:cyclopropane-fatty-acyl-phospholipid synthase
MLAQIATDQLLRRFDRVERGRLRLVTPDGRERVFEGRSDGSVADLKLHDWSVIPALARHGDIGLADGYRSGKWDTADLQSLMNFGLENRHSLRGLTLGATLYRRLSAFSYMLRMNTLRGSRKNIHAHYDLGNDFYSLWLDPTMTYSSALYKSAGDSLTQAQYNKYDRIIDAMDTPSGKVLEIGCGWGGFAERALDRGDYSVKGITLSSAQNDYARNRLGNKAQIALEDYRTQKGAYDRIVSIEMFEAVGEKFWPTYFGQIRRLMKENGRAVIQTITMNDQDFPRYRQGADFIRSFIFPGGMLPSPAAFRHVAGNSGLMVENEFFFGKDYARTLETWLATFDRKRVDVQALGYDEGFIRLWRMYLSACAAAFNTGHINVMHAELRHA